MARGDLDADRVFRGGEVLNVFTREIEAVDVAVADGMIAALGTDLSGVEMVDLDGRFLLPGFIDGHVHIESSMMTPPEFARAIVPRGTTTVIADPHEIANVHGLDGIKFMLDASEGLPLDVQVMASSCVPATTMGTAGAALDAETLTSLLSHPRVLGLAEVMNFPGVISNDPEVAAKIEAFAGRPVDGHAPGVRGPMLNAYIAGGPNTDHESTSADEALEKLRRGMFVLLREATNARNLLDLVPIISPATSNRIGLCTDDRQPPDLLDAGGIDHMLRLLTSNGVDPLTAIQLATLNTANHYGLHDRGAIAPGRRADFVVVEDVRNPLAEAVYVKGLLRGRDLATVDWPADNDLTPPAPSVKVDWGRVSFKLPAKAGLARVIEALPGQLITRERHLEPATRDGLVVSDVERDLAKIAVIERHGKSGNLGLGLVTGIGLREGAIAGTVAHDHHNIIAIGMDDASMIAATKRVAEIGGGLAVARNGVTTASLQLEVGGLMSTMPLLQVRNRFNGVVRAAGELGSSLHDPFMAMSFLGLEVIPDLKITDLGLVDVLQFKLVDLWVS